MLKKKSHTVWTSYGVGTNLAPFMKTNELMALQKLNRFWYEAAVSRVQSVISLQPLLYYLSDYSDDETNIGKLYTYDPRTKQAAYIESLEKLSMMDYFTV